MISALLLAGMMSLSGFVPAKPGHRPPPAYPVAGVVNLNTATAQQIALLPGVGRHRAKAIVSYRKTNHFTSLAQIRKVKGVGAGIFAKIKSHLTLTGPTTLHRLPRPAH